MRLYNLSFILLLIYSIQVLAKGGGGGGRGGGGGGGGGSRGGGSRGGGSRGSGNSGSGRGSIGGGGSSSAGKGTGSSSRNSGQGITAGGGSGSFRSPPSYSTSSSRQKFNSYHPTYRGSYGNGRYSGYVGNFRPGFPYFFVLPSFMFMGYYGAYHRYNSNQGAYYAPEMTSQGSGSTNLLINGTTYATHDENFHYTINVTARSDQFATIDMGYFGSSDLNTHPADFIYRLTMAHIVEFDDINNNGFYDAQEPILSITSLQKTNWQPMVLNNRTVPTNTSQTYLETTTTANITYNNTDSTTNQQQQPMFGISMTFRSTNLQLNGTAPIPLQPNSLQYDIQLDRFPGSSFAAQHRRVALAQVITTKPFTNIVMDVNTTTPSTIAQQIKTNITYGASVGNYSEGRLEYQPTVNITNMAGISTSTWTNLMDPAQVNRMNAPNTWGWGDVGVEARTSTMVLVTLNGGGNSSSYQVSGLAYLDTDIINAAISGESPAYRSSGARRLVMLDGGVMVMVITMVLLVLVL